jgi:hypothetical protein
VCESAAQEQHQMQSRSARYGTYAQHPEFGSAIQPRQRHTLTCDDCGALIVLHATSRSNTYQTASKYADAVGASESSSNPQGSDATGRFLIASTWASATSLFAPFNSASVRGPRCCERLVGDARCARGGVGVNICECERPVDVTSAVAAGVGVAGSASTVEGP